MNSLNKLYKNTHFVLLFLLVFFTFISFKVRFDNGASWIWTTSENGLISTIQLILLAYAIYIHIRHRKFLKRLSNKIFLNLRILMFVFLFYEEASWITQDKFTFTYSINNQSEVNFHQLSFLDKTIFENINMPFFDYSFDIQLSLLFFTVTLLVIGFGSYFSFTKNIEILFLEKKYSLYTLLFPVNIIIGSILNKRSPELTL